MRLHHLNFYPILFPDCGRRLLQYTGLRIAGGSDAPAGSWPWIASLQYKNSHICGANLIAPGWLLTAAHCVLGIPLKCKFKINEMNNYKLNHSTSERRNYFRTGFCVCVCLEYIQPICLAEEIQSFIPGSMCHIAGWGSSHSVFLKLQEASVPLVSRETCMNEMADSYVITNHMICAGYAQGGTDTCSGDSGGPLICEKEGREWLVGVTSFGVGCAQTNRPGIYAHVSSLLPWIKQQIEKAERTKHISYERETK
uniref:Peptidase S1 domain-containing protein n=1 Tax=Eptatretus burgeri TaxID=7764 RepID=A0A8C4R714_EPTBU